MWNAKSDWRKHLKAALPHPKLDRAVANQFPINLDRDLFLGGNAEAFGLEILKVRHVERASEIEADLRSRNLRSIRRSAVSKGVEGSDCLLIDTTGELRDWYEIATIVFIGKSLTAHGGQNPVEAISARKPVIIGPHMENFASLAKQLIAENGAVCVQDLPELIVTSRRLLRDAAAREQLVTNALRVLQPHRETAARTAALIEEVSTNGQV